MDSPNLGVFRSAERRHLPERLEDAPFPVDVPSVVTIYFSSSYHTVHQAGHVVPTESQRSLRAIAQTDPASDGCQTGSKRPVEVHRNNLLI